MSIMNAYIYSTLDNNKSKLALWFCGKSGQHIDLVIGSKFMAIVSSTKLFKKVFEIKGTVDDT